MRENLIKLLFEESKQIWLFEELEKRGIDMTRIAVQNSAIVFDIIGFPADNTADYDINTLNGMPHNPSAGKKIDENYFCRDWLFNQFWTTFESIEKKQKIEVTDNGLKLVEEADEKLAMEKLKEYVDWLYKEYYDYNSK